MDADILVRHAVNIAVIFTFRFCVIEGENTVSSAGIKERDTNRIRNL